MSIPKMILVESSNIKSVGYENDNLFIEYRNGVYVYKNVPERVYSDLLTAESKGRFVNMFVKPNYDYDYLR